MKQLRNLIPLLFLTMGLLLPTRVGAQPSKYAASLDASDVIAEVNALRAVQGLAPYVVDPVLMEIAQSHAEYMASSGIVTHYSADGSRPYQRAIAAGYPLAGDISRGGFFSENVDSGSDLSAAEVVQGWQDDPLHLSTMISSDLKEIGVGVSVANGITYYTLDAALASDSAVLTSSSPTSGGGNPFSSTTGTPFTGTPVITSTISEDGTVYHIVQANEALWSIALAYDTTIAELKRLNKLVTDDIFEGQKLVISKKEVETPTPEPSITVTLGIPTSTATSPVTPTATFTPTPIPVPPASRQTSSMVVGGIILIAVIAAGLGTMLGRRKSAK